MLAPYEGDEALGGARLAAAFAGHHEAGVDPDPGPQHHVRADGERAQRRHELEAGAHRPLGIVLARLGKAEIGEDAVAQIFGDVAAVALDDLDAAALPGGDDGEHVLGVEPARERGRAHHVAEHDGHLPPLGLVRRPLARRGPGRGVGEQVRQGLEEAFALAEAEADLLELGLVDQGEDVEADIVRRQRLRQVLEPDFGEPSAQLGQGGWSSP